MENVSSIRLAQKRDAEEYDVVILGSGAGGGANVLRGGVVSKNIINGKSRYDSAENPDIYIFRSDPAEASYPSSITRRPQPPGSMPSKASSPS
jgi:hypothetical protein